MSSFLQTRLGISLFPRKNEKTAIPFIPFVIEIRWFPPSLFRRPRVSRRARLRVVLRARALIVRLISRYVTPETSDVLVARSAKTRRGLSQFQSGETLLPRSRRVIGLPEVGLTARSHEISNVGGSRLSFRDRGSWDSARLPLPPSLAYPSLSWLLIKISAQWPEY